MTALDQAYATEASDGRAKSRDGHCKGASARRRSHHCHDCGHRNMTGRPNSHAGAGVPFGRPHTSGAAVPDGLQFRAFPPFARRRAGRSPVFRSSDRSGSLLVACQLAGAPNTVTRSDAPALFSFDPFPDAAVLDLRTAAGRATRPPARRPAGRQPFNNRQRGIADRLEALMIFVPAHSPHLQFSRADPGKDSRLRDQSNPALRLANKSRQTETAECPPTRDVSVRP